MRDMHEGHVRLMAILDDQIDKKKYIKFAGMRLVRQTTDAPLYGIWIDGETVTIFRADRVPSTTLLARQLRQVAAAYQDDDGDAEAAAEGITDSGSHSLH